LISRSFTGKTVKSFDYAQDGVCEIYALGIRGLKKQSQFARTEYRGLV
jgi:hypothetical protein